MDWERRCIRTCAAALLCAIGFRLGAAGWFAPIEGLLENPGLASFLVYLQTGRVVRLPVEAHNPTEAPVTETTQAQPTQPQPTQPQAAAPVFAAEDLNQIEVKYNCRYRPDLNATIANP